MIPPPPPSDSTARPADGELPVNANGGGMIVREMEPANLETPPAALASFITPSERFYVRCHHPVPHLRAEEWRLRISGEVDHPLELSYDELTGMEQRSLTVTMECAGNGRAFLAPQREGAQWEGGAVGTAVWTGVPLSTLLAKAGLRDSAIEIILTGADEGPIKEGPRPAGKIPYARSLPVAKAQDDVLLALRMNGSELSVEHGFPLRAVVPGWYGMAAVKWLEDIVATPEPFQGYYQTVDYAYWERVPGGASLRPITTMRVKSQIARPGFAEGVPAGSRYRIHGAAWSGTAAITRVEVSTDGGKTWHAARLTGPSAPHAWRLWEYEWPAPDEPGKSVVMARATATDGSIQPSSHHDDRGSYLTPHTLPVEVIILAPS
jgi:DMSO/TMAO reductase YedYZ molybdopterin-dependent catalytic subunit